MKLTKQVLAGVGVVVLAFGFNGAQAASPTNRTTSHEAPPQSDSLGEQVDDSVITSKVKASLLAQKNLKSLDIHVKTVHRVVYLSGWVDSAAQKNLALKLAREVEGVKSVKNGLTIK